MNRPPAWLVSLQDLYAGIVVPGLLSHGWLSLELVRHAFQDMEVLRRTFHIKEHQSYKHQPEKDQDEHKLFTVLFLDLYRCITKRMNNGGGGGGGGVRIAKMLILLSLKVYEFIFKFLLPFENCFPRCRFRVVASTLSLPRCHKRERTW